MFAAGPFLFPGAPATPLESWLGVVVFSVLDSPELAPSLPFVEGPVLVSGGPCTPGPNRDLFALRNAGVTLSLAIFRSASDRLRIIAPPFASEVLREPLREFSVGLDVNNHKKR